MSLRLRLLIVVATTFAVVVVGCVYAAHVSASRELRAQTDHFLLQRASDPHLLGPGPGGPQAAGQHDDHDGGPLYDQTLPSGIEPDAITQVIQANGSTNQLVSSQTALPVDATDRALAAHGGKPRLRDVTVDGEPYRMITAPLPNGGAVQVARSIKDTNNVLSSLDVRLLLIALAGTAVAGALAFLIARRMTKPIEQLTSAAEQVATTQDLEHHIDVTSHDELGRLATSFNTMLDALGSSREQQHRLVMDASHELRTPLTALRTNIEMLQRTTATDDPQRAELLAAATSELGELSDLVAELVDLATDARAEEPLQHVELADLVGNVVERQRRRFGRTITLTTREPMTVNVRAGALDRAVSNLIDNACKFSPDDAAVDVTVTGRTVEVADHGPGISAEDRAHVFDRFYRSATARTKTGSGLGLAIVQQIVAMHGGTVELQAREGGGIVARLTLPAAP